MNRIEIKEKIITISQNEEKTLYYFDRQDQKLVYHLKSNARLIVYQYGINIDNSIIVNLDGENSEVEYHYSTINYDNHRVNIEINHLASNTISHIYNHGLNVFDHYLDFDITAKVKKESDGCICNQENQIINLANGNSTILPNLLIDNYDISSSHSAYIGKFKEETLFYLMSRGIDRKGSYELLIKNFLINSSLEGRKEVKLLMEEIKKI